MRSLTALVVGTAGHIDHGKTSLVRALTGVDTDRLAEERRRGISIDIGFAHMRLPDGAAVSFIDVPGHEGFIRNMLAGAAGMEAVMLIVAANESVMPQTREHFEICRLLGLKRGLIVLTKLDLASLEQRLKTEREVQQLAAGSFLADAPVVGVSTANGAGLEELKHQLGVLLQQKSGRDNQGVPRLPIDHSFAVKGLGTVVTGTLHSGCISNGDTLELLPSRQRVRVRGLQTRNTAVARLDAGQRLAVNLAGIDQHSVDRGDVAVAPGLLACTRVADVELCWLCPEAPPTTREEFTAYVGTAEITTRIGLHRGPTGFPRFARLRFAAEVLLLPGDRLILRRPSPSQTVAGGVVIDAFPPRRVNRAHTLARLETLSSLDLERRLEFLVDERPQGLSLKALIEMMGAPRLRLSSAIENNNAIVVTGDRAVTRKWIDQKRRAVLKWLGDYHRAHPNAAGAPLAMARQGMDSELAGLVFKGFTDVQIQGELVALNGHRAAFSPADLATLEKMEQAFRSAGFEPPPPADVLAAAGSDVRKARALLEHLVKTNRLVRLPGDLLFHADVVAHIRSSLAQHKGRRFSVVEFKQWTNVSRKFAIPLLEHLDQQRVTKRDGDARIIL